MRTILFRSCLAHHFERFVQLRRLSGTEYSSQAKMLSYFDGFLTRENYQQPRITREIAERYQQRLTGLAPRTRDNRLSILKQFCEYYSRDDPHCYIPDPPRPMRSRDARSPYIYSKNEVQTLVAAARELPPSGSLRPHTYYTLLALLYCTGIRVGEAFALNFDDLHHDGKMLHVREGKFRKERWLPLSDSCYRALCLYIEKRIQRPPALPDPPLLINLRGRRLHHATVNHTFHKLLAQQGIDHKTPRPRLHDLRHTFAVHRLLEWYRDGEDLNARLPWLSTYMGHVDVYSTQVYLRATPELLEQVDQRFHRYYRKHVKSHGDVL